MEKRAKERKQEDIHSITNLLWHTRYTGEIYPINVRGRGYPPYQEHRVTRAPSKNTLEPYEFDESGENPFQSVKQLQTLMLLATVWRSDRAIEQSTLEQAVSEEWEEEDDSWASPIGDLYEAVPPAPSVAGEGEVVESPASPNNDPEDYDDDDDVSSQDELALEEELNFQENLDEMTARLDALPAIEPRDAAQRKDSSARGGTSEDSGVSAAEGTSGEVRDDMTPPVRRSARLARKRKASEEMQGDWKRRKDSRLQDIEAEDVDTDEE
jgi:hypothetical protein